MYKTVWTKRGWERRAEVYTDVRPKVSRWVNHNQNDYISSKEMKLIKETDEAIQTEGKLSAIDKLPGTLKDLLYHSHVWYIRNNKLFKAVDEITQAKEYDNWGIDLTERDKDERSSLVRRLLEDTGQIQPDDDLLDSCSADLPDGTVSLAPAIDYNASIEDFEEDDDCDDDIYVPNRTESVPTFDEQVLSDLREGHTEEEIEKLITPELTYSLNSPYTGFGYITPRRQYSYIHQDIVSPATEAAYERETFFHDVMAEAKDMDSSESLGTGKNYISKVQIAFPSSRKIEIVKHTGMYGRIAGMYQHDKELVLSWTEEARQAARADFIRKYRSKCQDEEKLRMLLWVNFDSRESDSTPAIYNEAGKLVREGIKFKDSQWYRDRTEALQDLFLRREHWDAIYAQLETQRKRIQLNFHPTEEHKATMELLRKWFRHIKDLDDLGRYRHWASSQIPYISIEDEHKWWKACLKLKTTLPKEDIDNEPGQVAQKA